MNTRNKALVIGDDTRSFLATIRSLGRGGVEVHVAPYDFSSPALQSKYIHQAHRLPYYLNGGSEWLAAITRLLETEKFDLVIPCEERALLPLHVHREALAPLAKLAIPDEAGLAGFFDKTATRTLAQANHVPVAQGRQLDDQVTASQLISELSLPLIIKPRHSYTWPDLYIRSSARLVNSPATLESWFAQNQTNRDQYIAESVFNGSGSGLSVLCSQGEILQAFAHERVNEEFGSSFYRKSVPISESKLAAVKAMSAAIRYTGLAMFEFKDKPDSDEWILLEVNARPWGSLPLPVALGVDFPLMLFKLLVHGQRMPMASYTANRYCRNTLADFWQLMRNLEKTGVMSLKGLTTVLRWLGSFHRILLGREKNDLWVMDDLKPAKQELGIFIWQRIASLRNKLSGLKRNAKVTMAIKQKKPIRSVLILCQGNICRSPYAELKLKALLAETKGITIKSAGMLARNARPSPSVAIAAAQERGIDLHQHSSVTVTEELLSQADLVLIFDRINQHSLLSRFPNTHVDIEFLGAFSQTDCIEIKDPEGSDLNSFNKTYAQIDEYLGILAKHFLNQNSTLSQRTEHA